MGEETGDRDRTISGSLVDNVKQINVLLNIPNNCNANTIYDDMIRQISDCKSGENRAILISSPDVFSRLTSRCSGASVRTQNSPSPLILRTSGIRDPLATENIARNPLLEFSKTENSNVAFPKDQTLKDDSYTG